MKTSISHLKPIVTALTVFGAIPLHGAIIFVDNFDNGNRANSDTVNNFWSGYTASGGSANDWSESGGSLSMTTGDNDGTNNQNFDGVFSKSAVSSDFNFFTSTITIQLRGISFSGSTPAAKQQLYFGLISQGNNAYSDNDNVMVRVRGDGTVRLGYKKDVSNGSTEGNNQLALSDLGANNSVTGFDLTLGPGTGTNINYVLTAFGGSGYSTSGSFAFDVADWNGAGGNAALHFYAQEFNATGGNENFTVTVDSLTVIPEPSSALLLGSLAMLSFLRRRRG